MPSVLAALRLRLRLRLTLLMVAASPLLAQQVDPARDGLRPTIFDTRHGLPANRVERLAVSSDGTVWAGTTNGLARYDHYLWHTMGEGTGILPGPIAAISSVTGTLGDVLVVVGGSLFRSRGDRFTQILRPEFKVSSTLPLASISPDSIFLVWQTRLALLENGRPKAVQRELGIGEQAVHRVWASRPGTLWILTDEGLLRWQGGKLSLAMPRIRGELDIDALAERPQGGGLLHVVKPNSARGVWHWEADGKPSRLVEPGLEEVTAIHLGPGFALLTHVSGEASLRVGTQPARLLEEYQSGRVLSAAISSDSTIWLGTERGVLALHRLGALWSEQLLSDPLGRGRVQELARAPDGALWAATSLGLMVVRPGKPPYRITEAAGVTLEGLTGLAIDSAAVVWVSSGGMFDGVLRYDGRSWQRVGNQAALRGVYGHRLRLDRTGRLWLLGLGSPSPGPRYQRGGAFVMERGRFRRFEPSDSGTMGGRVYDMDQGPDGALWFATINGISRYRSGVWRHWTGGAGLIQARVFTVAADAEGQAWFGHQVENQIGRIARDDSVHYLPLPPTIADTRAWAIRRAADGRMWLAGDGGIAVLSHGVWSGQGYGDGLSNTSVWPVLPESDQVLFGTGRGISRLDLRFAEALPPPRVALQPLAAPRGALSVRFLVGPYNGWREPDRVEVRYRLDDGPWSDWAWTRQLAAEDLRAGTHQISVQALGLMGHPGPVASASLRVEGPVWASFWFVAPATTALLLLLGGSVLWVRARRRETHLARQVADAYTDLYREAPDGYLTEEMPSRRILEANEQAARIFGYEAQQLVGMRLNDLTTPASRDALASATETLVATGRRQEMELRACRRDGSVFDLDVSTSVVHDAGGQVVRGRTILRDVSARKAAERDLTLFRITLNNSFEAALWLRPDGEVTYVNAATCRLLRISQSDATGHRAATLWPAAAPVFSTLWEKLRETDTALYEADFPFPDGSSVPVEVAAFVTRSASERHTALFIRDITDRRAQETRRREMDARRHGTQRLQALGTLAGGIAHEFNNLLAIILGFGGMMRESASDAKATRFADEVVSAATRGRDLVAQILQFSAHTEEARVSVGLSRLVAETIAQSRMILPAHVTVSASLEAEGVVLGSSAGLSGMVMNLLKNAGDAYGTSAGPIRVATRDLVLSEEEVMLKGLRGGRHILLTVDDEAGGMQPDVAGRVFEPFFTTKHPDRGVGLGLSVVHGVVTAHGGSVTVESHLGRGTRFDLLLPAVAQPFEAARATPAAGLSQASRRVMVIDDQELVVEVICLQLEHLGHVATGFQSASAALAHLAAHSRAIDLLLTDLAMPEMSGLEVIRAALRIRPDLPVVVSSGYIEEEARQLLLAAGARAILPKPFSEEGLARVLTETAIPAASP
jgi:PAS domain S-box-containing protein